jgi:LemA protein
MNRTLIIVGIIVALLVVMAGGYVSIKNDLVQLRENTDAKFAQIDIQLQRRTDLIPNLISTVKGFAAHEKEVIQSVTDARAKLAGAQTVGQKAQANQDLSGALSRLLVVVENSPTLKSDTTFRQLMDELAGTENRIAVARKDYNDAVQRYNTRIITFPGSLVAGGQFLAKEYFRAAEGAQSVPQVKF